MLCDRTVVRRLTHLIVLAAFIFSCGGQWYLLQGVAWANMIRQYSGVVPLAQAVHMTFSGQYPCSLCKAIAEEKESENAKFALIKKQEKKIVSLSVEFARPLKNFISFRFVSSEQFFQTRVDSPPTPPPRFA